MGDKRTESFQISDKMSRSVGTETLLLCQAKTTFRSLRSMLLLISGSKRVVTMMTMHILVVIRLTLQPEFPDSLGRDMQTYLFQMTEMLSPSINNLAGTGKEKSINTKKVVIGNSLENLKGK